ncbi:MAG: cadherin repeat domain-containing protein [Planctomycetaceae bacterium]|nr:cadherin repeat domain-containing protein [Planctomycetaceae bacterium]
MQKREKILAGILAVAFTVMLGYPMFASRVFGPITELKAKIKATKKKLDAKEQEELALIRAASMLAQWTDRSLPPNVLDAQRAYAAWLTDLADQAGWDQLQVTPGRISKYGSSGNAVEVNVEASATTDQIANFLNHFEGAALFQRIVRLSFEPESYAPETLIVVKLTAEGISITDSNSHPLPYTQWKLAKDFQTGDATLEVQSRSLYPLDGGFNIQFQNQMNETLVIKSIDSDGLIWKLKQDQKPSKKSKAIPAETVVYFKDDSQPYQTLQPQWNKFAYASPFAHSRPVVIITPRINLPKSVILLQGESLELTVPLEGFSNPEKSHLDVEFQSEKPEGLSWDQENRTINWKTTDATKLGDYPVRIQAKFTDSEKTLEHQLMIQVRKFNNPPVISDIPKLNLYVAEAWEYDIKATDQDEPSQKLTYSLQAEDIPELKLDSETGKLLWTPDQSLSGKYFQISIQVVDDGEPAKTSTKQITLKVLANIERTTELFACIEIDQKLTAWFRDVQSGKKYAINKGAAFESGRFKATLVEVKSNYVELQQGSNRFRVELGSRISERTNIESQK